MKTKAILSAITIVFLIAKNANAENYNLFNPVPDQKLRPLNTERSSRSDYVTTVDAGRIQLESSLISVTKNKDCDNGNCTKTNTTTFGDTNNIRIGLTENSDLQIMSNLYMRRRTDDYVNQTQRQEGYGDTNIRFKYSFSGNNGEKFGIAVTPFIKIPTNQNNLGNNDVEGGVSIPFAFSLDDGWTIGGMSQVNFLRGTNSDDFLGKYYDAYLNAIYVAKNINSNIFVFAEYATFKSNTSNSWWQNTADFGIHYLITDNFKIDFGTNIGLTNTADDLNYYSGITYRF